MREAINFGDVEFPIFFNYFCKKAFFNPDQKGAPTTRKHVHNHVLPHTNTTNHAPIR